jgi:hypothetical protein
MIFNYLACGVPSHAQKIHVEMLRKLMSSVMVGGLVNSKFFMIKKRRNNLPRVFYYYYYYYLFRACGWGTSWC